MYETMKDCFVKLLVAACLCSGSAAFAQEYHSNDLTPAGSASGRLNGTSGGAQIGAATIGGAYSHAVLVGSNALTAVDLHPASYYYSMAMCADSAEQGGWGYYLTGGGIHALVWHGSASSVSCRIRRWTQCAAFVRRRPAA